MTLTLTSEERVARARADLRIGAPVVLTSTAGAAVVVAAETASAERLAALRAAGAVDLAVPLFDTRDQVVASVAIEGVPEGQSEALVAADSAVSQIIRDFVEQARRETSAWEFSYEHVDPDMIAL